MRPIFNEEIAEKIGFVGPVNSAWDPLVWHISVLCLDVIRGSGSHAQCMGPTSRFVFTCFSIKKKKKKGVKRQKRRRNNFNWYLNVY